MKSCRWFAGVLVLLMGAGAQLVDREARLGAQNSDAGTMECKIEIVVDEEATTDPDDPVIKGQADCRGEMLYDESRQLSELETVELAEGVFLFAQHEDKGWAYLLVTGTTAFTCTSCYFEGLPPFPTVKGGSAAAIVVDSDSKHIFSGLVLYLLRGGYTAAGGMHIDGQGKVDISGSTFQECHGAHAGVFEITGNSLVTIELSLFEKNEGDVNAGSMLVQGRSRVFVHDSGFYSLPAPEEFIKYVLGDEDALPEDLTVVNAGAIAVMENAKFDMWRTDVANSWGLTGAIHSTHSTTLDLSFLTLSNNTGLRGGGVLVEGERGHFLRMHDIDVAHNTAREGGGMVLLGEGNGHINLTDFRGNVARVGGGFYSDFAPPGEEEYASCGKQTEGSRVSFDFVTFSDNVAETSGGGIHAKCSLVRMRNLTLTNNSAAEFGGGIFVDTVADLDFEFAPFQVNKAGKGGSAIYAVRSTLVDLEDCLFENNEVLDEEFGGTVMIDGTEDIVMKRVKMVGNTVRGSGGGLWFKGAQTLSMDSVIMQRNLAGKGGGAIFGSQVSETVSLVNVTIVENTAKMDGGGLVIEGAFDVAMAIVSATDNSAGMNGGGINFHGSGTLTMESVTVEDNSAIIDCGGLRAAGFGNIDLSNISLSRNSAAGNGGGSCFEAIGSVAMDESINVDSNSAGDEGGGIYISGATGTVVLSKTSMKENAASVGVAASLNTCADVTLNGLSFVRNSASRACGAIQASSVEIFQIIDVEFFENAALKEDGGALCIHKVGLLSFQGGTSFTNNSAVGSGGAVYVTDSGSLDAGSTNFSGNHGADGGAIGGTKVLEFSAIGAIYSENVGSGNGGGIFLDPIEHFELEDVVFRKNRARNGGGVKIGSGSAVDITRVDFSNNTASGDGGGIAAEKFATMDLISVNMTHNEADEDGAGILTDQVKALRLSETDFAYNKAEGRGGALQLLTTNVKGDGVHLHMNEAYHSGGAFLCQGDSTISMKKMNFTFNFARAGQSLSAYCGCSVNVTDSEFHREKHREHIGDFFEKKKDCAEIVHNNCLFFGSRDTKLASWVIMVAAFGGVLVLFCIVLMGALVYYRKKYHKMPSDEEDPIKEGGKDAEETTSDEYTTTDEEGDSDESDADEEVPADKTEQASKSPQEPPKGDSSDPGPIV